MSLVALTVGGAAFKLDYGKFPSRASYQLPERVIQSLDIQPGDRVADIGAGGGYFTFMLADAVGPSGKVYAVEIYEETVRALKDEARKRGYSNIVAVLGELDDPLLPDGEIDLVFLCDTYHHIDDRTVYFDRLRSDLTTRGRVAIIDLKVGLLIRLLGHAGHWSSTEMIQEEMSAANYRKEKQLDFLPVQNFLIYSVLPP